MRLGELVRCEQGRLRKSFKSYSIGLRFALQLIAHRSALFSKYHYDSSRTIDPYIAEMPCCDPSVVSKRTLRLHENIEHTAKNTPPRMLGA